MTYTDRQESRSTAGTEPSALAKNEYVERDRLADSDPDTRGGSHESGEAVSDADTPAEPPPTIGVARAVPPHDSVADTVQAEPDAVQAEPDAVRAEPDAPDRLLEDSVSARYQQRWRDVQAGFVDDPASAVNAASALLDEVSAEVTAAARRRGDALAATPKQDDETERLRTDLQAYRRLVNHLLDS